ncbi:hypothetical protein ACLOJK_019206 [Asimina triloba]
MARQSRLGPFGPLTRLTQMGYCYYSSLFFATLKAVGWGGWVLPVLDGSVVVIMLLKEMEGGLLTTPFEFLVGPPRDVQSSAAGWATLLLPNLVLVAMIRHGLPSWRRRSRRCRLLSMPWRWGDGSAVRAARRNHARLFAVGCYPPLESRPPAMMTAPEKMEDTVVDGEDEGRRWRDRLRSKRIRAPCFTVGRLHGLDWPSDMLPFVGLPAVRCE